MYKELRDDEQLVRNSFALSYIIGENERNDASAVAVRYIKAAIGGR